MLVDDEVIIGRSNRAALTIPDGAVHVLLVSLREMAPVHLDRITLYREDEEVLVIEAEDVEPLRPDDAIATGQNRFWIKSAERAVSHVSAHESTGIAVALSVLHQRQRRQMTEGDNVRFASLLSSVSACGVIVELSRISHDFSDPG